MYRAAEQRQKAPTSDELTIVRHDHGMVINSGTAIASRPGEPTPEQWLAGDVFNCFGDVLGSRDYPCVDLTRGKRMDSDGRVDVAAVPWR